MAQTEKFSQFNGPSPILPTDIVVGLRADPAHGNQLNNWQFTGVGSGSGGGVTTIITQIEALTVGQWVYVNSSGVYVPAQANTPITAEVIGVVINIPGPDQYTIQQAGYIAVTPASFGVLVEGDVYFLDTATAGNIVNVDATVNGFVSRPCFVADSISSGWVVPYRGLIVGGSAPSSGGGSSTDSNIVTVHQPGHGFIVGDWLYVNTDPLTGPVEYALAVNTSLATSQSVGVVVQYISTSDFVLQFAGYVTGAMCPSVDFGANPLIASAVYYLSSTPGQITSIDPGLHGFFSKPLFISEQTTLSTGLNAGYVLPQRPLGEVSPPPPVGPAIQANIAYNGVSQTILDSLNVASMTYVAVGQYQMNFVLPFANGNYYAICTGGKGLADFQHWWAHGPISTNPSVSAFRFGTGTYGTYSDVQYAYCQIWA